MTVHRSFKRLVRLRMAKTGESYAAARAALLAGRDGSPSEVGSGTASAPVLATSDEAIRQRTGRGWEEWFDLLDEAGMAERPHREIARWVAELQGVVPLAWTAQAVTVSYERARGGRAVGQHADGFTVGVSRTAAVPVERLFAAVVDEQQRGRWLTDAAAQMRQRSATRPRSARFDWGEDGTRVSVTFQAKDGARSTVNVVHSRLPHAEAAAQMKAFWRERLGVLVTELEQEAGDA